MNKSDSIIELAKALNKAQGDMTGAKKSSTNPFFKSKYSDLNSVIDAMRVPFYENGLSYSQFPINDGDKVGVETILMHTSGEWLSSTLVFPTAKKDAQSGGSAITYARRYALQAMAGIPSEDDDGNGAQAASKQVENKGIDLSEVAAECGWTAEQVCNSFNPPVRSLDEIGDKVACANYLRNNKVS